MKSQLRFKYFILIISFLTINFVFTQEVLESKYYFVNSGKLFSIEQRNDTLYEYRCFANFECKKKSRKHYKIIKSKQKGKLCLLLVERLDSIPYTTKPIRDERFSFVGFEKKSEQKLKFIFATKGISKDSINKIAFNFKLIENKFGFTFYEENYLKSLDSDFKIDKILAEEIMNSIKSSSSELIYLYQKSEIKDSDLYASGLIAELIAREMIKRNLSPINARKKIEKAIRE